MCSLQEEEASLPAAANNRDENNLFESHPRPGVPGELLGDCRLDATVGGTDMWQVRSSGQLERRGLGLGPCRRRRLRIVLFAWSAAGH